MTTGCAVAEISDHWSGRPTWGYHNMQTEAERKVWRLTRFLDWILQRNESGLAILLGNLPPLSAVDIFEMKRAEAGPVNDSLGVRITGGKVINYADAILDATEREACILEEAGGWKPINNAFRYYRVEQPDSWKFFVEHTSYIRPGGSMHDGAGGMSSTLERKYGLSSKTMRRRRNRILRAIANSVYLAEETLRDDRANYLDYDENA